jgi:hypothetical protein
VCLEVCRKSARVDGIRDKVRTRALFSFAVEDAIAMLRLEELYIVSPRLIPFFYRPSLT